MVHPGDVFGIDVAWFEGALTSILRVPVGAGWGGGTDTKYN